MSEGKIKSKQLEGDISLNKLSGEGQLILASSSQIQITGTATSPNDLITKKELDSFTGGSGGGTPLTVQDYNTGFSYSNISTIVFRGETVTIPGSTATGALATSNGANSVLVWIPAPTYVDYLTLNLSGGITRFIASPTTDGNPYSIGIFSTASANKVVNSSMSYGVNEFGYFDDTATFELNIYDSDDTTVLDSLSFSMSEIAALGSTVSANSGITFNMLSKGTDQDRRKADISVVFDPSQFNSDNGGRFTNEIIFTNTEGGGAGDDSITETYFYDPRNTTADIDIPNGGTVSIEEKLASIKYVSGVAYYDETSTFTFSVTEIDNLNDSSYPQGTNNQISSTSVSHQLRILPNSNFGMSSAQTKWVANTDFVGWNTFYNVQSLAYYGVSEIDTSGVFTPGLNADNTLDTSNYPDINAVLFDWTTQDSTDSAEFKALIDTANATITDDNTESFIDESRRLTISDLLNGDEVSFDSQELLSNSGTYSYELQQIFGHLVYPKINFSDIYPQYNITNTINYSSSATQSVTLTVINNMTSLTTTTVTHTDHRWYARKFTSNGGLSTFRGGGKFEIDTDFGESDLLTTKDDTSGSGNLLIYMALSENTVPTQWLDLSKKPTSPTIQGPRANTPTSNLVSAPREIEWNIGNNYPQGWTLYLLIGIKNTSDAKEIEQIDLYDTDGTTWGT